MSPKVGRNDPCPCGSGKKYKKCCERNAAAKPAAPTTLRTLEGRPVASGTIDPRVLAVTTTGEFFQPVRIVFDVLDPGALSVALGRLDCVQPDATHQRSVWLWADEARRISFKVPFEDLPAELHPIVLANLRERGATWIVDVRSVERALEALRFFTSHLPRKAVRPSHLLVVNKLSPALEAYKSGRSLDDYLDREAAPLVQIEALFAEAKRAAKAARGVAGRMDAALKVLEDAARRPTPELERIDLDEDIAEEDFATLKMTLGVRSLLALEHWNGNTHLTQHDVLKRVSDEMLRVGG